MKKNGLGSIGKRFLIKISDEKNTANPAFKEKEKDIAFDYAIVTREDKDRVNLFVFAINEQKSFYLTVWKKDKLSIINNTIKKVEFLAEFKTQRDFVKNFCRLVWHKIPSQMKPVFVSMSSIKFIEDVKQTTGLSLGSMPILAREEFAAVA